VAVVVRRFRVGKDQSLDDINTFLLEQGLRPANVLSVSVTQQGKDNLTYFITYEDTTSPFLLYTIPATGEDGVPPQTPIIAVFSEPIQNVTVADVEIVDVIDNSIIATSAYTIDNTGAGNAQGTIQIVDTGNYQVSGRVYRVTFKISIQDLNGNPLETAESISFGVATTVADLTFDGGRIENFANPSAGRWTALVVPARVPFTNLTLVQLTLRAPEDTELKGYTTHYEAVVSPTGTFRAVIEATGLLNPTLPIDTFLDWTAFEGLL